MTISNYLTKDGKELIIDAVLEMAPRKYWEKKQEEWSLYHNDGFHFANFSLLPSKNSIALYDNDMLEILSLFNDFTILQRPEPQVQHEDYSLYLSDRPVAEEYYEKSHSILYETFDFFAHVIDTEQEDDQEMFLTIQENMKTFITRLFSGELYNTDDPEILMMSHKVNKYISGDKHDKLYLIVDYPAHEKVVRQLVKRGYSLVDTQNTSVYGYIE